MPASPEQSEIAAKKHAIIMKYWAFSGWSAKKISEEFSRDEDLKREFPEGVSVDSVIQHIRRIRIELEAVVDEDALEKYTSEFIRKQYQYDQQLEDITTLQNGLDKEDIKDKELWLKCENAKTNILDKQIKMMSDIELVLMVKQMNAKRRKEMKTLKKQDVKELATRVAPAEGDEDADRED
ncbi:MAG: hypothetical protein ACE5Q4_02695 [Nitrosopumilus sp.]